MSFGQQYFALRDIALRNTTTSASGIDEISQAAKLSTTPWRTNEERGVQKAHADARGRLWIDRAQFIYYMRQRGFQADELKTLNRLFSR